MTTTSSWGTDVANALGRLTPTTKSLSDVQIKDADKGTVEAVFSTFGVIDKDGDVTYKTSFTDGAPVVISSYGHTSWDGSLPVGKGVIALTNTEAVAKMQFFMDTTHGRDTFHTVKALSDGDSLQEWSYSLQDVTAEPVEVGGVKARGLMKINVKEVSPVLVGASINTRTLAVKAADLTFSDHREAVLTALDDLTKRCMEVVTLRVAEGKPCPSAAELLAELDDRVKGLRDGITAATNPPPCDDDIREWMRSVAIAQGVTLS